MRILKGTLLALFAIAASLAQQDNASILGLVSDSSGAVVPRANVEVRNNDTGQTVKVLTDANGNFFAPVLPVGTYRVTVSAAGFKSEVHDNLTLRVADRLRLEVKLDPGAVQETVTVLGSTPLVDTASSTLGGVVNSQQVANLPMNGRDIVELLALVPGVMLQGGATQQSVNGASTFRQEGGMRFMLDGTDASRVDFDILENTYSSSRGRVTRASPDSIQEFRVQSSSYSAEYGQALGGVINIITKSGTNQSHGTLFEYFRNEKLDSRAYFNPAPGLKPPFRLNQFGGSVGGPLIHDKLFFFANYEGVRQRLGKILNVFVPTEQFRNSLPSALKPAMDMLPLPNGPVSPSEPRTGQYRRGVSDLLDEDSGAFKLDYNISSKDRLTGRYNANGSLTNVNFGVARGQVQTQPAFLQLSKLTYTRTISPRLLNEAGFAFNRVHIDPRAASDPDVLAFPITSFGPSSAGVGPATFDLQVANNSFTWLDTLSWVRGRHQLKFGAQIVRNQDNKALNFQRTVTYQTLDDVAANSPFSVGTLGQPRAGMRNTYNQFFVQDDVQATRKLGLNLGLRYQYDTTPNESHGRIANFDFAAGRLQPVGTKLFDAPKTNFAPRFGVAYAPFGNGRTVIRTGFGLFFASLNAAMAQNVPNNISQQASSITRQQVPTLVGFPFPVVSSFGSVTSYTAFFPQYHGVYAEQWNFNIQQAVGKDSMFQVGYTGNRGLHLNASRNMNRLFPGTALRPYPAFGNITTPTNNTNSSYNAFQTSFRRRFHRGLTVNANYTWAHTLDQGGVSFGSGAQDDTNYGAEYGNADYDVRHVLEFDYTYELPAAPKLPSFLGRGWQINGITQMRSGLSVNVTCGCDSALIGSASARPDRVPGVALRPDQVDIPGNQYNIAAFTRPPNGRFGNVGRNILKGPDAYNWNFSTFKNFRVREGQSVQFRAEMFNIFNTPQFGTPGANLSAPNGFGKSLGTISTAAGFGTNRQVQFALRYAF
jgi:hypothetical protein